MRLRELARLRFELPARLEAVRQIYAAHLNDQNHEVSTEAAEGIRMIGNVRDQLAQAAEGMRGIDPGLRRDIVETIMPVIERTTLVLEGHAQGIQTGNVVGIMPLIMANGLAYFGNSWAPAPEGTTGGIFSWMFPSQDSSAGAPIQGPPSPSLWSKVTGAVGGAADTAATTEKVAQLAMWGGLGLLLWWGFKKVKAV